MRFCIRMVALGRHPIRHPIRLDDLRNLWRLYGGVCGKIAKFANYYAADQNLVWTAGI